MAVGDGFIIRTLYLEKDKYLWLWICLLSVDKKWLMLVFSFCIFVRKPRILPTALFWGPQSIYFVHFLQVDIYLRLVLLSFLMALLKIANNSDWGEFGDYSLESSEVWILFQILYFKLKMNTCILNLSPFHIYVCFNV